MFTYFKETEVDSNCLRFGNTSCCSLIGVSCSEPVALNQPENIKKYVAEVLNILWILLLCVYEKFVSAENARNL